MKSKNIFVLSAIIIIISMLSIVSILIIINSPDHIPPLVTISTPSEDEHLSGIITISFTATDQQGVIQERQIWIDDVLVKTSAYNYNWNTTQEENGTHIISCRAKDRTVWGTADVSVIVDNIEEPEPDDIPPNVIITSPIEGATVSGIVSITMDASDASGVSSYAIYIDDIHRSSTNSYSWNTTQELDGNHTILCEATDPYNNTGSDKISVTVNNSMVIPPPKVFKVMTFNVKDSGEDPAYPDWKTVVKEENADIIMFIETGYWDDNSNEKLNQYLNEFNTYFTDEIPYIGYCTQGISLAFSGAAIMSRYPVIDNNQISSVPLDNTTNYDVTHDFFDVEVNVSGTLIHLIGSHLKSMPGTENKQRREWEQEGIINYMDNLGNKPLIYLGDLNSYSPEDWGLNTFQSGLGYGPLSMMVPPYVNPDNGGNYSTYSSTIHNWTDVHRTLNPTDWGVTYPGEYNSRIDFIYVNQLLASYIVNSTTGDTIHANSGSDHYTVDVYFNLV
jgi:endonuclease/exonuclease/phosphatase family metal-dependent hydrolase